MESEKKVPLRTLAWAGNDFWVHGAYRFFTQGRRRPSYHGTGCTPISTKGTLLPNRQYSGPTAATKLLSLLLSRSVNETRLTTRNRFRSVLSSSGNVFCREQRTATTWTVSKQFRASRSMRIARIGWKIGREVKKIGRRRLERLSRGISSRW